MNRLKAALCVLVVILATVIVATSPAEAKAKPKPKLSTCQAALDAARDAIVAISPLVQADATFLDGLSSAASTASAGGATYEADTQFVVTLSGLAGPLRSAYNSSVAAETAAVTKFTTARVKCGL
jgi:hypothetical protein